MFTPNHRYEKLLPAAHRFARVPRYGRLLSQLPESQLQSIDTEAQLFWSVYSFIGEQPEQHTGILHDALRRPDNRSFGWHGQAAPDYEATDYLTWQIRLAMDMLGALAFAIMFGDEAPWDHRDRPRDSIDEDVQQFREDVLLERFVPAGVYRNIARKPIDEQLVFEDWQTFVRMNSQVFKHFVLSRTEERSLRFNDISTQAFFAAYWAANYVRDDKERERLWSCIPDDWLDERQAYAEFWTFLAEMPQAAFHRHKGLTAAKECWEALLWPVFRPSHRHAPRDSKGQLIRASRLIYHAWDRMKETEAGLEFRGEFGAIARGDQGKQLQDIAQRLLEGFRFEVPLCEGHRENDTGEFVMGCSEEYSIDLDTVRGVRDNPEHTVKLTRFWMNVNCVRNVEYELFEPRRFGRREFAEDISEKELAEHPVVNASWYDAVCYARWLGELRLDGGEKVRIELPTEAQWEYVCRAGVEGTAFSWDGVLDDNRIESGYCNFYGIHPWISGQDTVSKTEGGQCLGRTIPVEGVMPDGEVVGRNRWEFNQCHGNVWEWCMDWYDAQTYHNRILPVATNPQGPSRATWRVLRGGSWINNGAGCRAANRVRYAAADRNGDDGFRLAAVPDEPGS